MNVLIKALVNRFYKPLYPIETILYITNKCNLRCGFCDIGLSNSTTVGKTKHSVELSRHQIDVIINAMKRMNIANIYITGGEPFLARNLWYLLESCASNNIAINGITTNGSLLNVLSQAQIALLNSAAVRKIIISLDHPTVERHDNHRGRSGLFNDIMKFLTSSKADLFNSVFCYSVVINNNNYRELSDLVKLGHSTGKIRHINFQPVCIDNIFVDYAPASNSKEAFHINTDALTELDYYVNQALRTARTLHLSTSLPFLRLWIKSYFQYAKSDSFFFNYVMKSFICSKPYNYLHVNYNGDMLACTHIGPDGNINDTDIERLWKDNAMKYKNLLSKRNYFKQCRNCFCDFAANYRHSLLYSPFRNIDQISRLIFYYIERYRNQT